MNKYLIIGGLGRVGQVVEKRLEEIDPDCSISIWDQKQKQGRKASAADKVIISCVDTSFDRILIEEILKTSKKESPRAIVTLGGDDNFTSWLTNNNELFTKKGLTVIPDSGLAPGLPSAIAALGYQKGYKYIDIGCGGVPLNPLAERYRYLLSFSTLGLYRELTGPCKQIINKQIQYVPALWDCVEKDMLENYGTVEWRYTSAGLSNCPEYYQNKLWGLTYSTLRHPEHWELLTRNILQQPNPAALMEKIFTPVGPDNHDLIILRYKFTYGNNKVIDETLFCKYDTENKTSALCLATGYVTAQTALLAWEQKPGIVGVHELDPEVLISSVPWTKEV